MNKNNQTKKKQKSPFLVLKRKPTKVKSSKADTEQNLVYMNDKNLPA